MEEQSVRLLERIRLSGKKSLKPVYHLAFDASEISYQHGDALAVYPENSAKDVERLTGLVDAVTENFCEAVLTQYDITHLSNSFLEAVRQKLPNSADFDRYGESLNTATVSEILEHFNLRFSATKLIPLLKKLRPRLYSVTSSPEFFKHQIQLIVAEVSYTNCFQNTTYGVASRYLCDTLSIGNKARVAVVSSKFKLPENDLCDVIMVGPGTGIAPFRSFLQERAAKKIAGHNIGRQWLFFGDQHYSENFYYKSELENWLNTGILTHLSLAFSRDQDHKIYVQDRMREQAETLWQWIDQGAYFYICGDAKRMAVDVESTLKQIIQDYGNCDPEQYLKAMKIENRYQRDVY